MNRSNRNLRVDDAEADGVAGSNLATRAGLTSTIDDTWVEVLVEPRLSSLRRRPPGPRRQIAGVVEMGMGQHDRVDRGGLDGERFPVLQSEAPEPVKQTGVHEDARRRCLDREGTAGHRPRGTRNLRTGAVLTTTDCTSRSDETALRAEFDGYCSRSRRASLRWSIVDAIASAAGSNGP